MHLLIHHRIVHILLHVNSLVLLQGHVSAHRGCHVHIVLRCHTSHIVVLRCYVAKSC